MSDPISNMILRANQCRQLAAILDDEKAAKLFSELADETESQVKRLLAGRQTRQ